MAVRRVESSAFSFDIGVPKQGTEVLRMIVTHLKRGVKNFPMTKTADIAKVLEVIVLFLSFSIAESKGQSAQGSDRMQMATYVSPDKSFALESFRSSEKMPVTQVDYVNEATRTHIPLDIKYALIQKPVFLENSQGFFVYEGTSSMGAWPLFYKRNDNGGIDKIGPSLSDDGSPVKLGDNIMKLIPKDINVNRLWISVREWNGGETAKIDVSVSTGHGTRPFLFNLVIPEDTVSKVEQ